MSRGIPWPPPAQTFQALRRVARARRVEDGAVRETADERAARQHVWLIYRRGCASGESELSDETQDALCAACVQALCGAKYACISNQLEVTGVFL